MPIVRTEEELEYARRLILSEFTDMGWFKIENTNNRITTKELHSIKAGAYQDMYGEVQAFFIAKALLDNKQKPVEKEEVSEELEPLEYSIKQEVISKNDTSDDEDVILDKYPTYYMVTQQYKGGPFTGKLLPTQDDIDRSVALNKSNSFTFLFLDNR